MAWIPLWRRVWPVLEVRTQNQSHWAQVQVSGGLVPSGGSDVKEVITQGRGISNVEGNEAPWILAGISLTYDLHDKIC